MKKSSKKKESKRREQVWKKISVVSIKLYESF